MSMNACFYSICATTCRTRPCYMHVAMYMKFQHGHGYKLAFMLHVGAIFMQYMLEFRTKCLVTTVVQKKKVNECKWEDYDVYSLSINTYVLNLICPALCLHGKTCTRTIKTGVFGFCSTLESNFFRRYILSYY